MDPEIADMFLHSPAGHGYRDRRGTRNFRKFSCKPSISVCTEPIFSSTFCTYAIYTMKQTFSNFFQSIFFMIKYEKVFYMRFIGRVQHNFTFHDNFARAFLTSTACHATLKKACKSRALHSTCIPCHQNLH